MVAIVAPACSGSPAGRRGRAERRVAPSLLVNRFMGTGIGGSAVGEINASPAAAVPLGLIQWGPDTAPDRASGGGYRDGDTALSGLSLTHLSGPGCPAYGDVPILPSVGVLAGAPETTVGHFAPATQRASPGRYSVALARPFRGFATWEGRRVEPGTRTGSGQHSGAAVTFDATRARVVDMRVGVSFVSIANARANLASENHGDDVDAVARAAAADWNAVLDRIAVGGGTSAERRTFYSALYHSLLHPNVFSDGNGEYPGFDGRVHTADGYTQYANFSGWDIYRSEVQLRALVVPSETGDMMHSLLADYEQSGFLPKWAFADYDSAEINGDSADPILADAYAFGVRNFDAREALRAMLRGANTVGHGVGWDVARQDNDQYLSRGWIQVDRRDKTSFDYTIGGSETLEYAIDDNAIAHLAEALGDRETAATFTRRAGNWRKLFNPATRHLAARRADGSFPPGPAFQRSPLPGIGQDGWEEGNATQYTWSVPQDLRGLFDAMGGNARVVAELDRFFTRLNTSRKEPYSWAGNEPALASPLFPRVTITLGTGRRIEIDAPGASASNRYVRSLRVDRIRAPRGCGTGAYECPWLPSSVVTSGAHLRFELGGKPNHAWGASARAAPPSITETPA